MSSLSDTVFSILSGRRCAFPLLSYPILSERNEQRNNPRLVGKVFFLEEIRFPCGGWSAPNRTLSVSLRSSAREKMLGRCRVFDCDKMFLPEGWWRERQESVSRRHAYFAADGKIEGKHKKGLLRSSMINFFSLFFSLIFEGAALRKSAAGG